MSKEKSSKDTDTESEVIYEKEEKTSYYTDERYGKSSLTSGRFLFGLILIIGGALLILKNYIPIDLDKNFWAFLLIIIGVVMVSRSFRK